MKYQLYFFLLLFLSLTACIESEKKILDNRTDKEIDSLIQHHKKDLIFMSFWSNMPELDFKRVVNIENKKGLLSDGKFNFKINKNFCSISVYKDEENVLFDIKQHGKYINLAYIDEYWVEKQSERYPKNDGTFKAKYYNCIIESLIEHFDSKYERLVNTDSNLVRKYDFFGNLLGLGIPTWKKTNKNENDIIISLGQNVTYFDKKNMSWHRETKKNKELLAKCEVNITFKSYQTYLDEKEEKRNKELLDKEIMEFEKKKSKEKNDLL